MLALASDDAIRVAPIAETVNWKSSTLTRWKFIAGVFDRHSTRCDEAGIGFAEMEKLAARLSNAHGEFNGDYVNGEQQRLHRVCAEYSPRLTASNAVDLKRANPCLVRS
jgi:hypothetical protein